MILYQHTYNAHKKTITTIEIEVEEKPKTYKVIKHDINVCRNIISKDSINELMYFIDYMMVTLTPDTSEFINALIKRYEDKIRKHEEQIREAEVNLRSIKRFNEDKSCSV